MIDIRSSLAIDNNRHCCYEASTFGRAHDACMATRVVHTLVSFYKIIAMKTFENVQYESYAKFPTIYVF